MRKLYLWIVLVVAVICIGVMVDRYSTEACANRICGFVTCMSDYNCGYKCFCLKRGGEALGECYQN